jgi:hypothetical protein
MNDELVMPDHISTNCKDLLTKVNIKKTKILNSCWTRTLKNVLAVLKELRR